MNTQRAKIASLPAAGDKGSKRVAEAKAKSLPEARARLAELQKVAIQKGIQLPPALVERPRTLDQGRSIIAEIEQQLSSGVGAADAIGLPEAKIKALTSEKSVAARAREFLASQPAITTPPRQSSKPPAPIDPRDLSALQLERQIEIEKRNPERVALLYRELNVRRSGKPSRQIVEATYPMTMPELERAITAEKDTEQRQMLYWQLQAARRAGE
jgi:hypothetical protein